ncbi:MAG: bifunctional glutamate N-acetyltransferase/amino-acid acetyltransferase ArgJ [Syntrophales bacterium]|nr:bifunctional glutamate N-acetyltransferase/amino-acid acetyltransferase ArgJ [Syntrophales bacterium]MDD4338308.1 bifunctional glutamate N-acetyltransferase/amino-acid acetyltransferase ArgJ [Syntrophales bacterium]
MERNQTYIVPGFTASGIAAGIKADGRTDLALIRSDVPAVAAGVFTTNRFPAAPVQIDRERIARGAARAILANSGNANAATGPDGLKDALASSRELARRLAIPEHQILVASTGVIGHRLPLEKILAGLPRLVADLSPEGIPAAEEAILTTDRFPKLAVARTRCGGRDVTVCGLAKGAGMIEPHMATMLAFILTDAVVLRDDLDRLFRRAVRSTFNAISVDGCESTNDTALILANGVAANRPIAARGADGRRFGAMLTEVMGQLARDMVEDGEGATKRVEICVSGARTRAEARRIAYAVARSNLVKTAFYGGDPNWGRIIAAAGSVGIALTADRVTLHFEDVLMFADGQGRAPDPERIFAIMQQPIIRIRLEVAMGKAAFVLQTSDLTRDYVALNAHYHT